MPSPPPTSDRNVPTPADQQAIALALFRLGRSNLSAHLAGQVCLSLLVASGSYLLLPRTTVLVWLIAMVLVAVYIGAVAWAFSPRRSDAQPVNVVVQRWRWANYSLVLLAGMGWGSVGFLLVPDAHLSNLLIMIAFAGALGYSAVSNAHHLGGFVASVLLASVMLISQLPGALGAAGGTVMAMVLLYLPMMIWAARNAHLMLIDAITLRLQNEALAQANAAIAARAEQANRDKSEFLAAASHDLRQPVHALLLLIEAYRQQEPSARQHPLVLAMAQAGQSIGQLFNSLMELSRLETGAEQAQPSDFALHDSIELLLGRHRMAAERRGLRLRLRLSAALRHATLHTDRVLFERVVGNLLSNAVRYTERGGVLLALRPQPGTTQWWLDVIDTGAGIAAADRARIFDPYVQLANRARERGAGLGLGLAIVHHACALLGLRVSVASRLGRGSRFRLTLPADTLRPQAAPPAPKLPSQTVVTPATWLRGRRLLLVDDDPLIQQGVRALLGGWGMDVRVAGQGDPMLLVHCTDAWAPDCVLSDFRLPGPLDGVAVLDLITQHCPHTVGLLLTGELAQTVAARAEEAGYLLLSKPVDAAVLAQTLAAVLERRTQARLTDQGT